MSMEESVFFVSEYIQRITEKGSPLYDKVQNLMLPRDSYLKPICAGSTTSKTTPSYDSKFETTADQTTRYKEQQPNFHNKTVATTKIQIKPDDEIPPPKYHDRDWTCNTTPLCNKIDDTPSRPPVPRKGGGDLDNKLKQLTLMKANREPPDLNDEISPPKYYDRARTCSKNDNTTSRPPVSQNGGCYHDPTLKRFIPTRTKRKPPDECDAPTDLINNSTATLTWITEKASTDDTTTSRPSGLNR